MPRLKGSADLLEDTRVASSFTASTVAPVATGWGEPVPGRDLHPLWTSALSRCIEKCGLEAV